MVLKAKANMTKVDLGVVAEDLNPQEGAFSNNLPQGEEEEVMEVDHQEGVRMEEDNLVEVVSSQEEEEVADPNPLLHILHTVDLLTHANANLSLPHRRS